MAIQDTEGFDDEVIMGDVMDMISNSFSNGNPNKGLILPSFRIGPREDPPYDIAGSLECMAWEMWLDSDRTLPAFQYTLAMQTEDCFEEAAKNQMHDLSPWLARFVSKFARLIP